MSRSKSKILENRAEQENLEYFEWLADKVGNKDRYRTLLKQLHDKIFAYTLDLDRGRALDGCLLQNAYCKETDKQIDGHVCTVLEMLISLSNRMSDEYLFGQDGGDPKDIFWRLIENLGLLSFHDEDYNYEKVNAIISKWLRRKYEKNGVGSIFPMGNETKFDQRLRSIWAQMQEYLSKFY